MYYSIMMPETATIHLSMKPIQRAKSTDSKRSTGVPIVAQWLTTRNHEVEGSIPALPQWVKDPALP